MNPHQTDAMLSIHNSGYSAEGFARRYDLYRPQPPPVLLDVLTQLLLTNRPRCVVDFGSGTGLSTYVWSSRADQVIGIEPNDEMRTFSESRREEVADRAFNVRFESNFAHQTNLPDATVDLITCAQSLHWMEPTSTLTEAHRILREGGILAAYDYDSPTMNWRVEQSFSHCMALVDSYHRQHGNDDQFQANKHPRWSKEEHLSHMKQCGQFQFIKEFWLHSVESGTADRLLGLTLSLGTVARLLAEGVSEADLAIDELRCIVQETLGDTPQSWYFSYHVIIAVK